MEMLLRQSGYTVEEAGDGAKALAKARVNPPDLLLCDYLMPMRNGDQVISTLRGESVFVGARSGLSFTFAARPLRLPRKRRTFCNPDETALLKVLPAFRHGKVVTKV